jgi:LacI family transcriptional regulator
MQRIELQRELVMNIYDIAKEAGVSISTVSRVLNNKSNVKDATRKKVESVLEKYDYAPNAIARGLVSKSLNNIGILTIDIRVPHYAATAYTMERELYKMGYNAILCNTGGDLTNGMDYINMLLKNGVSGVILIGSVFQNKYIETSLINSAKDVPFIVQNSVLNADNTYSVMLNHAYGITLCLDHLCEKGHRDILYVQDAETFSGIRKADEFQKQTKERGLPATEKHVFKAERSIMGGSDAADRIVASGVKFSAAVFGDDITAVGALQRFQALGYNIPGDVAVIGWNNSISARVCIPNLTTVDNQTEMIGILSVKLMENLIAGAKVARSISVDSGLIIRDST